MEQLPGLYGTRQAETLGNPNAMEEPPNRLNRWMPPGDLDGLLGLGLNNLIQILLIIGLCRGVLGFPDPLLFGRILPATGISTVTTPKRPNRQPVAITTPFIQE